MFWEFEYLLMFWKADHQPRWQVRKELEYAAILRLFAFGRFIWHKKNDR